MKAFASALVAAYVLVGSVAAQTVAEGEALYARAPCRACHGRALAATPGQTDLRTRVTYPFSAFADRVRNGVAGTDMEAFGDRFPAPELCSLYLYVRSFQAHPAPLAARDCDLRPAEATPPKEPMRPPPPAGTLEAALWSSRSLFTSPGSTSSTVRMRCRGGGATRIGLSARHDIRAAARSEPFEWSFAIEAAAVSGKLSLAPGECRIDPPPASYLPRGGVRRQTLSMNWTFSSEHPVEHVRFHGASGSLSIDSGLSLTGFHNPYAPLLNAAGDRRLEYVVEILRDGSPRLHGQPETWTVHGFAVIGG